MNKNVLIAVSSIGFNNDMELGIAAARLLEAVNEPPAMKKKIKAEVAEMLRPSPQVRATPIPKAVKKKVHVKKPDTAARISKPVTKD